MSAAAPIVNSRYAVVGIDKVKPHPRNPRRADVKAIGELIDSNGFYGAIVVQESTGHILAGNHRWQAARLRGQATIPAIYVDVSDEHALRILLSDNRSADTSSYDDELLAQLITSLPSFQGTGWTEQAVSELLSRSALPEFEATEDDQGHLDHLRSVECPRCHHTFELSA
jgi:ParB-like chromosome segregation protein Spo0J